MTRRRNMVIQSGRGGYFPFPKRTSGRPAAIQIIPVRTDIANHQGGAIIGLSLFRPNIRRLADRKDIPGLLRLLGHRNPRVRTEARKVLFDLASTDSEPFVALLASGDPELRRRATEVLDAVPGAETVPPSTLTLDANSAPAAVAPPSAHDDRVAGTGAAVAVPLQIERLGDPHPGVREETARALGRRGDATAARPLVGLLARDPEEEVRAAAAEALGALADPAAIPVLREALADRSQAVRFSAAAALEGLGWRPAGDDEAIALLVATAQWNALGRFGAAAAPQLVRSLGDDYYGIRRGAAGALLALGAAARPALERARSDPDPAVREEAAALLARMGPEPIRAGEPAAESALPVEEEPEPEPPAEPEVEPEIEHEPVPEPVVEPEPEAVPQAAPAPPTLADLAGRLYAGEPAERLAAAAALAGAPPERAVPALAGVLLDRDPALREAAVQSLGGLSGPNAMALLIDRLADPDEGVRGAAVQALAAAGPAAVPHLVAALGRPERGLRAGAADLLARVGPALSGSEEIALGLGLEDWRGLARFGEAAIEPLAALLAHPDPDLRLGAVIALGEIDGDRATDLIRQAYADPSPTVRNRAALLLRLRRNG